MKRIIVLGSTGSIGTQSLDVVRANPAHFQIFAITGGANLDLLAEQAWAFRPRYLACTKDPSDFCFPAETTVLFGEDAVERIAAMPEADVVINGISGFAALRPLLAALQAGKTVALANKESIVCGHALVDDALARFGGTILPVDSEQSAIFQCLSAGRRADIRRILLTASGGPFWQLPREELNTITVADAMRHPTWAMGKKITIDSATLFNKGLEVMETSYLFHIPPERITVCIHPQSLMHSAVEYADGTIIANLSNPDMRLPIQYALTYPERIEVRIPPLTFRQLSGMTFFDAPRDRFPALRMAYASLEQGGSAPVVYNGANEVAVAAFMAGEVGFLDIERIVGYALEHHQVTDVDSLHRVLAADADARTLAKDCIRTLNEGKRG